MHGSLIISDNHFFCMPPKDRESPELLNVTSDTTERDTEGVHCYLLCM